MKPSELLNDGIYTDGSQWVDRAINLDVLTKILDEQDERIKKLEEQTEWLLHVFTQLGLKY